MYFMIVMNYEKYEVNRERVNSMITERSITNIIFNHFLNHQMNCQLADLDSELIYVSQFFFIKIEDQYLQRVEHNIVSVI